MPNAAIELHDSRVTGIHTEGSDVVLDFDAYVHMSDGEPGVDAGTGWKRPVRITVREGVVRRAFGADALWITNGVVWIGERMLDDLIPLALDEAGIVRIELVGAEGRLTVTGAGLRIEVTGDGVYVERFPGSGG